MPQYIKIEGKEDAAVLFELTAYVVMPKNGKKYVTYIACDGFDIGQVNVVKNIEPIATLGSPKTTKKNNRIAVKKKVPTGIVINIWDDYHGTSANCTTHAYIECDRFSNAEKKDILESFYLGLWKNYGYGDTIRRNRKIVPKKGVTMKIGKDKSGCPKLIFKGLTHEKRDELLKEYNGRSKMQINLEKVTLISES